MYLKYYLCKPQKNEILIRAALQVDKSSETLNNNIIKMEIDQTLRET